MRRDGLGVSTGSWFFLDQTTARLILVPGVRGVSVQSRAAVFDHRSNQHVKLLLIEPGNVGELDLSPFTPLSQHSVKLQVRREDGWRDVVRAQRLATSDDIEIHRITPRNWGVAEQTEIRVLDPDSGQLVHRGLPPTSPDEEVRLLLQFPGGKKLQLAFRGAAGGRSRARNVLPAIRLTPQSQLGMLPHDVTTIDGSLAVSRRTNVILAPAVYIKPSRPAVATQGLIGAREGDIPIVEAMDFVLGKQRFLFADPVTPAQTMDGPAIYLGRPHASWGHFLTEGLARVWFALANPDLPVLWDAGSLAPHLKEVLDLLGMRNEQLFLTRPSRINEVLFPYPGISLGDYVLPEHARRIGRVQPTEQIPGKRLFISRARMATGSGRLGKDEELDALVARHGFTPFAPERLNLREQLAEISSAETVLGVEGSAFHTLLLLASPLRTRFWALSRHRGGSGIFDHVRAAKNLSYETLDFLRGTLQGQRVALDLDVDALNTTLDQTDGLTSNLEVLGDRLEHPSKAQTNYEAHLRNTQVAMSQTEAEMVEAVQALRSGNIGVTEALLSNYS